MEQAISDIQWFAKRAKGVIDILPKLEEISSLENNIKELKNQKEQSQKEIKELDEHKNKASDFIKEVIQETDNVRSVAATEAKAIVEKAKGEAQLIVGKAQVEAQKLNDQQMSYLNSTDKQINEKKLELDNLNSKVDFSRETLSNLEKEIDGLKKKFS